MQDNFRVGSFVSRRFDILFAGATNIEWVQINGHFIAGFNYRGESWLAFYNAHGEQIAAGRKMGGVRELPLSLQLAVSSEWRNSDQHFGKGVTRFAIELCQTEHALANAHLDSKNWSALLLCA